MIRDLLNAPQTPENEMVLRSLLSEANPANFANETARLGNYLPPTTGFQQSPTQRNIEQFAREDMRAAEQAMIPRQPEPAPAPVAPEPQNWIQRTGGPKISLDQYAQPSQVKTFATDALDYSRPVDFGGTKGYWIKGEPSKIALADGRIVDTNPPVRKTLAEQRAELAMEKDRLEIEKLRRGGDTKQSWKTVESGGKLYQINESTGDMRPAMVDGEQLVGKDGKGAAKSGGSTEIAQMGVDLIDRMIGKRNDKGQLLPESKPHPGFETYVGATVLPGLRFMEGSDTATFQGMEKQLTGQAMLEAYQQIRGTGAISNKEGESATAALNRMNKALNEDEYVRAALEFRNILDKGVRNAREGKFPYSNEVGAAPPSTNRQQQFRVLRSGG